MDISKSVLLLPLGLVALVGACAPYPPGYQGPFAPQPAPNHEVPSVTDEQQRQIERNRERLRQQAADQRNDVENTARDNTPDLPKPDRQTKPKYPTASPVPGKPGFVFNPYTHNIVDVRGIGSGKLCRDPEDSDPSHKFRVP